MWTALGMPVSVASEAAPDISARSAAQAAFRRAESQSGELGHTQIFPRDPGPDGLSGLGSDAGLTVHDRALVEDWEPDWRRDRWRWSDSSRGNVLSVRPEAVLGGLLTEDSPGNRWIAGIGATLHGEALGGLSFYTHGLVFTETAEQAAFFHQFNPDKGESYTVEKGAGDSLLNQRTFNRHEYYLKYRIKGLTLRAGRDWMHLGPGYFSSLLATRETPPYPFLEGRLEFAPWLFLDNYLVRMTDTDHGIRKYGHFHRFEFKPWKRLSLGFSDAVIYQDRDPDPRYLIPLVPMTFTEQNHGGLDNTAMLFDFLCVPIRNLSVWGELFIDDLLGPTAFFEDWWENRWATLAGFQAVSPWKAVDADIVFEFTHVEPWTYIGRSRQSGFKHFDVPSASPLGPDSRSLEMRLSWRPLRSLELAVGRFQGAKGTQAGSNLNEVHDDALHGTGKRFLAGREDTYKTTLRAALRLARTLEGVVQVDFIEARENRVDAGGQLRVVW